MRKFKVPAMFSPPDTLLFSMLYSTEHLGLGYFFKHDNSNLLQKMSKLILVLMRNTNYEN